MEIKVPIPTFPTASATTATLSQNKQKKEPSKARLIHILQAHLSIGKDCRYQNPSFSAVIFSA